MRSPQDPINEINARVFQDQIDRINREITKLKATKETQISEHIHNGFDSSRIAFSDIAGKKIWVNHTIVGATADTAANYAVFFIVPFSCYVTAFKEVHQTAGSDVGAVTLDLEKLTGTQALGAGVSVLNATLSLKATANTVQTATLTGILANKNLAIGDRLALKRSGTLTAVANVSVFVELQITQNTL